MTFSLRLQRRSLAVLGAAAALAALSGCQNHKIIARVNGAAINDDEYNAAVSRIKTNDFQALTQQGVQTDAGGAGLVVVVKEKLLEKLAAEKNAMPMDDAVNSYVQYLTRTNPGVLTAVDAGQIAKDDLPHLIRDQMIRIALGSNNAAVPEDEIKKEYDEGRKNPADQTRPHYDYPEMYGLRAVPVPSQTEGIELINQIKATGDFTAAAAKINPQAGHAAYVLADRLPAPLKDALAALKEGQLASAPISLSTTAGSPPTLLVVQLIKHMPKADATIAEAHEAIRETKLQQTQPQILQHSQEVINEYNQKANWEVYIDRYKSVVKAALAPPPPAPAMSGMGAPGGAMPSGAGGASAPGGVRRMMPSPGSAAPRSVPSGGAMAPSNTAKPTTGAASKP